jgi:hypothetical protein
VTTPTTSGTTRSTLRVSIYPSSVRPGPWVTGCGGTVRNEIATPERPPIGRLGAPRNDPMGPHEIPKQKERPPRYPREVDRSKTAIGRTGPY